MTREQLEDRVAELEDLLGVSPQQFIALQSHFGLTKTEARFLGFLAKRDIAQSVNAIHAAIYGERPECDQPEIKIINVVICNMRKRLGNPDAIVTVWGAGYSLSPEMRDAAIAAMRTADQRATVPEGMSVSYA